MGRGCELPAEAGRTGSWEGGARLADWYGVGGHRQTLGGGSGPVSEERQCPLLSVPLSVSPLRTWLLSGELREGGGKLTGFALCWWRMWPTPSQQSRLAEQQRKLAFEQKCHQAQNGTVAPSSMGAEVGAPPPPARVGASLLSAFVAGVEVKALFLPCLQPAVPAPSRKMNRGR